MDNRTPMDNSNWRNDEARQKIVKKIMDTLQRHMPQTGLDGMQELRKIAIRFEEKIFNTAQNQHDYLRKISLKMLSLETKASNSNQFQSGTNQQPLEHGMMQQQQMRNQPQALSSGLPLPAQSQAQSSVQQNMHNNINATGITNSTGLATSLSSVPNMSQPSNPNAAGQGVGLQSMPGMTQSSINSSPGQVFTQNALLTQRQLQARQQQHPQQSVQQSNPHSQAQQQQMFFKQQQTLLQQKNQQYQMQPSMLQQQQTALPQNQMQQNQSIFQSSQQSSLQPPQSSILQQSQSSLMQTGQQNVYQQPQQSNPQQAQSVIQQQILRQQHQQQQQQQQQQQHSAMQQQQPPSMVQQSVLPTQQHQPLMPSQSNMSSFQQHQLPLQQLLQSKSQQQHQGSTSLLQQSQSQQLQQRPQQLLPQLQSQVQPMQQQFVQQSNTVQHDLQPRVQASRGLLQQQQNPIDQQKQIMQQRGLSEASSASMDSSSQGGQPVTAEQEKLYQRIQSLKERYILELKDLWHKLSARLLKPMPPDQEEKFKTYKTQIHKMLQYFSAPKSAISANFKEEHVDAFERRILNILNSFKAKPSSQLQHGQQQIPNQSNNQAQSMQQQTQTQVGQAQEKHVSPFQQMNLQSSVSAMQPNSMVPVQQSSMPILQQSSVQASQQPIRSGIQPAAPLNSSQTSVNTIQQNLTTSLTQNTLQQTNIGTIQQSGINPLQNNLSAMQQNSGTLPGRHPQIKQQDVLQAQQMKLQYFQQQQLQKQQQSGQLQHQFQVQQMPQMQQNNDDESKSKQAAVKTAFMQQHQMNQRSVFQQQQQQHIKAGSSLSVSSSQMIQAQSPQVSQQSSPQIDQQNLLTSSTQAPKSGTPLQSATSPFLDPSPSTLPVPSPIIEEAERQSSATPSHSNAAATVQGFQQTTSTVSHTQSLAIGTPGISASPLLDFAPSPAQNTLNQDGNQTLSSGLGTAEKSGTTEPPLDRLVKAISSVSPKVLASAANDISSVLSLMDRMAGSAPGNGSRAAVGEDLVAMTKCRLQARNLMSHDGNATKKMRRCISSMPLSAVSSTGSVTNSLQQHSSVESLEMESTATSKMNHILQEEIQDINSQLIDSVVDISEDDNDAAAVAADGRDGVIVKCSYSAMALSPNMKSHYNSSQVTPISPLRLLVPENYPNCSPMILDRDVQQCKDYVDLSSRAKSSFHGALRTLPQPMSLKAVAKIWDECARTTVAEYAHQSGGGSFSLRFGRWQNCASA